MKTKITREIPKLTTSEKIELIGDLWTSIGESETKLTCAQDAELSRRLTDYREGKIRWVSAEKAEKEIRRRR
jgi:putative addiction module component (TIGR02574 family)